MYFLLQLEPFTYIITSRMYARHDRLLRANMCEHPEVAEILGAID